MTPQAEEFLNGTCYSCGHHKCAMCGRCGPLGVVVMQAQPNLVLQGVGMVAYCNLWCAWEQRDRLADLELITSDFAACDQRPVCPECNTWGWVVPMDDDWYCRPCEVRFTSS